MGVATLPSFCTYGRPLALRDLGGIALSIGSHAPSETVPTHRHIDEYQWCLTLVGAFEEEASSRLAECSSGSLLVRPPDCVHSNRFAPTRGVCLNLFPRRTWLARHELDGLSDTYSHQRSYALQALGRDLALELRQPDSAAQTIELLAIELLERATRLTRYEREGKPKWFALALDQIEAEPAADLRLTTLASNAGVSAGHLARSFRALFGKSVGEYVRERRLERAAAMIRDSRRSLAEIATLVGFCDQAHFSRAFKLRFAVSPAAYGKALRS